MRRPTRRVVAALQAAYYLPTAVVPFVSRGAFEAVTGPKREWWLVQTVSTLVGAVGASLACGAGRDRCGLEIAVLGSAAAAGLAAIDIVYVARRRISPVYLLDGVLQVVTAGAWAVARPAPQ